MYKRLFKVKLGIRDHWSKPDARVQKAITALRDTVGLDVDVEPDWHLLLAELGGLHPDIGTYVPSVAVAIEAFCLALTNKLEEEGPWADTFLETAGKPIRAFYDVDKDDASLTWDTARTGFLMKLPKTRVASLSELEAVCKGALAADDFFSGKPTESHRDPTPSDRAMEDWADVAVDRTTGQPSVTPAPAPAPVRPVVDRLPDLALLARPDELLREPPYHLTVYGGHGTVEIHGSHSQTLELIAAYLKKYVRTNHHHTNNPPCVVIKLHQSSFGPGVIYDKLTMEVNPNLFTVSPMIVLPLIESRLGYEAVKTTPSSWIFRKDTPFRR